MSDKRPTSELAADVRAGFVRAFDPDAKLRLPDPVALAALAALVARITDLEARNATLTQNIIDANARSRSLAERHLHDFDRAEAAEAQVAAQKEWIDRVAQTSTDAATAADEAIARAEAAEAQVAALNERIECANTPLMHDVLAAKLAAEAALATTRQALADIAQKDYWRDGDALRSVARRALAATEESA